MPECIPASQFSRPLHPMKSNRHGLIVALVFTSAAFSQTFRFREKSHLPVPSGQTFTELWGLTAMDIDGDGDLDLFGGAWLLNEGDATFAVTAPPYAADGAAVGFGDVNGDGLQDVVTASAGGFRSRTRAFQVHLRTPGGTFQTTTPLPGLTLACQHLALVDGDGDGDLDVLLANAENGTTPLLYVEGDGLGGFQDATAAHFPPLAGVFRAGHLHSVDIDSDGLADVVARSDTGATLLLRQASPGVYVDRSTWLPAGMRLVTDMNGDGHPDLVVDGAVLFGDGTGQNWTSRGVGISFPPVNRVAQQEHCVKAADFDGDGLLDVIVSDQGNLSVALQTPSGFQNVTTTFVPESARTIRLEDMGIGTLGVGDFDGDGDVDVVSGGAVLQSFSSFTTGVPPRVLINQNGRRLVDTDRTPLPRERTSTSFLMDVDIDGDGDVDLLASYAPFLGYREDSVVWINDGTGYFTGDRTRLDAAGDIGCVFADFDGDGYQDYVGLNGYDGFGTGTGGRTHLALGNAQGVFTEDVTGRLPNPVGSWTSAVAADFDGDGDIDLVLGNYDVPFRFTGDQNRYYENDGTGRFTDQTSTALPTRQDQTIDVRAGDLDHDGDVDLVVANSIGSGSGMGLRILLNDGGGRFQDDTPSRMLPIDGGYPFGLGDVDGDGDLDIAMSEALWMNDGMGVFTRTGGPNLFASTALGDIDGDGMLEVVEGRDEEIRIDGRSMGWGYHSRMGRPLVVDLDQDGDLDIACANLYDFRGGFYGANPIDLVLFNERNELHARSTPRVGFEFPVSLGVTDPASSGFDALPMLAATSLTPRVLIPGVGRFGLDPATLVFLPPVHAVTPSLIEVRYLVPPDPALQDAPFAIQVLFASGVLRDEFRLSRVIIEIVR